MPMPDSAAGTEFTTLDAAGTADGQLAEQYAYPGDLTSCWVRANFITSLDGAATAEGKSGVLGGHGDRTLYRLMRELCDVVLVGAGTVRIEGYAGVHLDAAERQRRNARGQSEVPPIAMVTRSAQLDHTLPVFTQTEVVPLILTTRESAGDARDRFGALAGVHDCSAADPGAVDLGTALRTLADLGLLRVLTEGGPSLLGALITGGLLDELCLTIAPTVVGGSAKRISEGHDEAVTAMRRRHTLTDDEGYLYTRYSRD